MIIFGITGGSGSGKTSVSAIFAEYGVHVIDTDVIAHDIVGKGMKCLDELVRYFGNEILNEDGILNRRKLASIAFSDDEKKALLNKITHKYIKERAMEYIANSHDDIIAIDGAVIIGSPIEPLCQFIVSVISEKKVRIDRIQERDNLTTEQAIQRIDAQPSDEFYKLHSKYIIYNSGSFAELKIQVQELYNKIKGV